MISEGKGGADPCARADRPERAMFARIEPGLVDALGIRPAQSLPGVAQLEAQRAGQSPRPIELPQRDRRPTGDRLLVSLEPCGRGSAADVCGLQLEAEIASRPGEHRACPHRDWLLAAWSELHACQRLDAANAQIDGSSAKGPLLARDRLEVLLRQALPAAPGEIHVGHGSRVGGAPYDEEATRRKAQAGRLASGDLAHH